MRTDSGSSALTSVLVLVAGLVLGLGYLVYGRGPAPRGAGPGEGAGRQEVAVRDAGLGFDAGAGSQPGGNDTAGARSAGARRREVASTDHDTPSLRVVARLAEEGTPVAGFPVRLMQPNVRGRQAVRTDAEGEARFAPIRAGRYHIVGVWVSVDVAEEGETVREIELTPMFELRGQVVDAELRPIPGAAVWVTDTNLSFDGAVQRAVTGADGRFGWTSFTPVECVFAVAQGYSTSPVYDFSSELAGGEEREIRIALRRAEVSRVEGVVLSAVDAAPVAGGTVTLRPPAPAPVKGCEEAGSFLRFARRAPWQVAQTDADGRFHFDDLTAGEANLRIRAEGFGVLDTLVELQEPGTGSLRFELGEALVLEGEVVDAEAVPIEGAAVRASYVAELFLETACSDADGRFELSPLPGRKLRVVAIAEGYDSRADDIEIPVERLRGHHRFVLDRQPRLRARLLDERGQPLQGWMLSSLGERVVTAVSDADGVFELPFAEAPELVASAPAPGFGLPRGPNRPVVQDAETDREGRHIYRALDADRPSATIAGRVVFEPPLAEPRLVLWMNASALRLIRRTPLSLQPDGDGFTFESGPWPAGDYELQLMAGEGEVRIPDQRLGTFQLAPRERLDLGPIQIAPAVPLDLEVVRPDGVSARGLHFELTRRADGEDIPGGLDLDGRFHSVPLAPGDYRVRMYGSGFAPIERNLTLTAGEPARRHRIELTAARDLKITCELQREDPPRGRVRVLVHDHDTGELRFAAGVWSATLLRHGAALGLPDGRYRISLSCGGDPAPVFFTPGGDSSAHFILR